MGSFKNSGKLVAQLLKFLILSITHGMALTLKMLVNRLINIQQILFMLVFYIIQKCNIDEVYSIGDVPYKRSHIS